MDEQKNQLEIPPMPPVPASEVGLPQVLNIRKKKMFAGLGALVIFILGVSAYYAYASPGRIWQKFSEKLVIPPVVSQSFSVAYEDKAEVSEDAQKTPLSGFISKIKFSFQGTAYSNSTDADHLQGNMDMNYSFGSGDTSLSSKLGMVIKDKDLFLNLGDNPVVTSMLSYFSPDEEVDWIKLNLTELQELANESASGTSSSLDIDYNKQVREYRAILEKHAAKMVTVDKYLGREDLHGSSTFHYSNKLDKNELKLMLEEVVDYAMSQVLGIGETKPEDMAKAKEISHKFITAFTDRLEVHTMETWVGASDFQLHKIKFASNAPSLASLFSVAMAAGTQEIAEGDPDKTVDYVLQHMTFDAAFSLEEEFYDFGKTKEIVVPEKFFDLVKKLRTEMENQSMFLDPGLDDSNLIK